MSATDQELHGRWVQEKDADAFSALVRAHGSMVYATCRRVLGDATEAEDLTQECFWKFARETRPVQSVGAWLHTVATRLCISRLRSDNRRQARERKYSDDDPNAPTEHAWLEVIAWVDEAIDRLPEGTRDVLVRHYFEGTTHSDLAEGLNVSPSTVTRRIQRGVERIREELSSKGMTVSVAALATGLAAEANTALPSSVQASLVKIGLGAVEKAAATGAVAATGPAIVKTGWAAAIAIAALVLGWTWNATRTPPPTLDTSTATIPQSINVADEPAIVSDIPANFQENTGVPNRPAVTVREIDATGPDTLTTVHGRVLDQRGFPVAGARISITKESSLQYSLWHPSWSTHTMKDGQYSIGIALPEGNYSVTAAAPGYQHARDTFHVSASSYNGSPPRNQVSDIVLNGGVNLRGRVFSRAGQPVPHALIRLEAFVLQDASGSESGPTETVSTDENGRFVMGFRTPGFVALKVATEDDGQSVFYDIPVGNENEVPLRMQQPATVYGRVSSNAPAEDHGSVEVEVQGKFHFSRHIDGRRSGVSGLSYRDVAFTNPQGDYRIGTLPAGLEYDIRVLQGQSSEGAEARALSDTVHLGILPVGTQREWNYTIGNGYRIRGRVTGAHSGMLIPNLQIMLVAEASDTEREIRAANGTFETTVYTPSRYFVYPNIYMQEHDQNIALGQWVDWRTADSVDIEIRVPEPHSIGVEALTVDGQPIVDAEVRIIKGSQHQASNFRTGKTDADGRFRFAYCLPGGEHWLVVDKHGFVSSSTDPILGKPGEAIPTESVTLHRAGGLSGIIAFSDGMPVASAKVSIVVTAGADQSTGTIGRRRRVNANIETDSSGYFSTGLRLPEGTLDLVLTSRMTDGSTFQATILNATIEPERYTHFDRITLFNQPN